ncbi:hypothetical protein KAR28_05635 [Candidatus Parcubacteria bacterium]|nr:hypothetical protein [Candidatus Parcubacteria bacterium]
MKSIITVVILFIITLPGLVAAAPDLGMEYAADLGLTGFGDNDPRNTLVDGVKYLMTFLGIIAVTVVLWGGFRWMVSMGNEDRLATAKATLSSGLIGLAIILVSFTLVNFIVDTTSSAIAGNSF